jgi:hypothetical protein
MDKGHVSSHQAAATVRRTVALGEKQTPLHTTAYDVVAQCVSAESTHFETSGMHFPQRQLQLLKAFQCLCLVPRTVTCTKAYPETMEYSASSQSDRVKRMQMPPIETLFHSKHIHYDAQKTGPPALLLGRIDLRSNTIAILLSLASDPASPLLLGHLLNDANLRISKSR